MPSIDYIFQNLKGIWECTLVGENGKKFIHLANLDNGNVMTLGCTSSADFVYMVELALNNTTIIEIRQQSIIIQGL